MTTRISLDKNLNLKIIFTLFNFYAYTEISESFKLITFVTTFLINIFFTVLFFFVDKF